MTDLINCQQPLTLSLAPVRSISGKNLTNVGKDLSGVIQLAEALKQNSSLVTPQ